MIEKMGYKVKLARVTKRVNDAYFAQLYLTKQYSHENESISFDIRPSDAINIAVKCKVPIQVNKYLAYSDGLKVVESAKPFTLVSSHSSLLFELDRGSEEAGIETKEFILLRNMLIATVEEHYIDAG
ncbi:unnamed protein product [Cuscuta campestris]|uniref:BFN domain-containing protein n=1 Tax=Cuscuta campestris TaxID=132261 RepID=A0A484MVS6_9ASTE|nr:unnamed protein product [Cuscuta campestris]